MKIKVSEFERAQARQGIERSIKQLRDDGYTVEIVHDCVIAAVVSAHRGWEAESDNPAWDAAEHIDRMIIDPLGVVRRARQEAA
jgi:hypothetical protein